MFANASPIWISGKVKEKNTLAVFRTHVSVKGEAELRIAVASFYRVFVDGRFVAFGPARTAKGYARVDRIPLAFDGAEHELILEVEGLGCRSLSTVLQKSYCIAELLVNGESVLWTGRDFEAFEPPYHVQKTERYSMQRHYTEVRDYRRGTAMCSPEHRAPIAVLYNVAKFLERNVPYPKYDVVDLQECTSHGALVYDPEAAAALEEKNAKKKPYGEYDEWWGDFHPAEIYTRPYEWFLVQAQDKRGDACALPITLSAGEYAIFDLKQIETGFLRSAFEALEDADVVVAYSEYYEGARFSNKNSTRNVIEYFANAGQTIDTQSFEPYSFRFVMVMIRSGSIRLSRVGCMRYERTPDGVAYPDLGSDLRNLIYRASVRTLVQNSVDIYMDCPSRERAGWLCDSYFTGRAEHVLFGTSCVEHDFLENFRLFDGDEGIPQGALPMCYPADIIHRDEFIPQWDMWYVLELEEYLTKRAPKEDPALFRASVMGILDFLSRYENEDGLLEKLPSWNFVEWSRANKWTKDVNYPTNFLYARTLLAAYNLYGGDELLEKSRRVAEVAKQKSFNGELFVDHAIRGEDGVLRNAEDISEICQYYAILFADLDLHDAKYAALLDMVTRVFLPSRVATPEFDVEPVNAFIGVYLRMDVLLKLGAYKQALAECEDFFGGMAQKTATLWENRTLTASCNHGFASYAAAVMLKCLDELK